jgi:GLPGLI family protein
MKFLVTLVVFLFTPFLSQFAVAQEGVISYEVTHNLRTWENNETRPSGVPDVYFTKEVLYFNHEASLSKRKISQEEEWLLNGNNRVVLPQYEVYIYPYLSKRVMVNYFEGRKYITHHTTRTLPWKIEDESKIILGYTCQKATFTNDEGKTTIAWFTYSLRPNLGPYMYYTLPGAVLEIDIHSGASIFKATSIDLKPIKKKKVAEPHNGKKVTPEQYDALIREYWEQLQKPGGNIKIQLN